MPRVVFFREANGRVPVVEWLDGLPDRARAECITRMEQLVLHGHTLRRPHADLLRDGIYELRAKREGVNYRLLFFFHGRGTAVVSHGITKQGAAVPPAEIARALRRKKTFETNPGRHGSEGA